MNNEIFRKKSLDKMESPDDLSHYLRVAKPPLWIALIAIIVILVGAIAWSITAKVETKVPGIVVSDGTESGTLCYVSEEYIDKVLTAYEKDCETNAGDTKVRVDGAVFKIEKISEAPEEAAKSISAYAIKTGDFKDGEYIYALTITAETEGGAEAETVPQPGTFSCEIVVERVSPISFILSSEQ